MPHEGKIGFLAGVATTTQSEKLAALAYEGAAALIQTWGAHVPQFVSVSKLLEALGNNAWFLAHGGKTLTTVWGTRCCFATAYDWTELLTLPGNAVGWTPANDKELDAALLHYRKSGVYDERYECTTLD
jgi:hypothetical protein